MMKSVTLFLLLYFLAENFVLAQSQPDTCSPTAYQKIYSANGSLEAHWNLATSDNGSIIAGEILDPVTQYDAFILKLNASGKVEWARKMGSDKLDFFRIVRETADKGFIGIGSTSSSNDVGIYIVRLDNLGNTIWAKKFTDPSKNSELGFDIIELSDGHFVFTATINPSPPNARGLVVKLNVDGSIVWTKELALNEGVDIHSIIEDGNTLIAGGGTWIQANQFYDGIVFKMDKVLGTMQNAKRFNFDNRSNFSVRVSKSGNGYLASVHLISDNYYNNKQQGVLRMDNNLTPLFAGKFAPNDYSIFSYTSATSDGGFITSTADNSGLYLHKRSSSNNMQWQAEYRSGLPNVSDHFAVNVSESGSGGFISSYSFLGNSETDYKILHARTDVVGSTLGCEFLISDQFYPNLPFNSSNFNWAGVSSYNFNTLDISSFFNVPLTINAQEACYFSPCSNTADTCNFPLDLGSDLNKCSTDTLIISLPSDFSNYQWSTNYNIDTSASEIVHLWPAVDTSYMVKAEHSSGCVAFDTLNVVVNISPPVDLGADLSFCKNDSAMITANAGFIRYTWNTGDTGQTLVVRDIGRYSVIAVYANDCYSLDTINVKSIFPLPVVNLGTDTMICEFGSVTFNPGQFVSYQWQDRSTQRNFVASVPGEYWVRVRDDKGCFNSDTIEITGLKSAPKGFVDPFAEICTYDKITISAIGNFSKYKWSTGSTGPTTLISSIGNYWLEVTDDAGCTNRENIIVSAKQCPQSIHFPNAFSPTGQANSSYRPVIKGQMDKYRFLIYDRWGKKIFETNDPMQAWDGKYKGTEQGSNTFTWYCIYQFTGQIERNAKGSLILIR